MCPLEEIFSNFPVKWEARTEKVLLWKAKTQILFNQVYSASDGELVCFYLEHAVQSCRLAVCWNLELN